MKNNQKKNLNFFTLLQTTMSIANSAMIHTVPIRMMAKFIHFVNFVLCKALTGKSLLKIILKKITISKATTDQRIFQAISCASVHVFKWYSIFRDPKLFTMSEESCKKKSSKLKPKLT